MLDASLQTLLESVSTFEFEEFGWIAVESADLASDEVIIDLAIHQGGQQQRWRLRCRNVRDCRIVNPGVIARLLVESDHPLLLPHVSPIVQLYFRGSPKNVDTLVGEVVEAHERIVGHWFHWTRFLNLGGSARRLLEYGHGMFAVGPQPLVEAYANVLQANGMSVSSPPARGPTRWDGSQWIDAKESLLALVLDESFVVAPIMAAESI